MDQEHESELEAPCSFKFRHCGLVLMMFSIVLYIFILSVGEEVLAEEGNSTGNETGNGTANSTVETPKYTLYAWGPTNDYWMRPFIFYQNETELVEIFTLLYNNGPGNLTFQMRYNLTPGFQIDIVKEYEFTLPPFDENRSYNESERDYFDYQTWNLTLDESDPPPLDSQHYLNISLRVIAVDGEPYDDGSWQNRSVEFTYEPVILEIKFDPYPTPMELQSWSDRNTSRQLSNLQVINHGNAHLVMNMTIELLGQTRDFFILQGFYNFTVTLIPSEHFFGNSRNFPSNWRFLALQETPPGLYQVKLTLVCHPNYQQVHGVYFEPITKIITLDLKPYTSVGLELAESNYELRPNEEFEIMMTITNEGNAFDKVRVEFREESTGLDYKGYLILSAKGFQLPQLIADIWLEPGESQKVILEGRATHLVEWSRYELEIETSGQYYNDGDGRFWLNQIYFDIDPSESQQLSNDLQSREGKIVLGILAGVIIFGLIGLFILMGWLDGRKDQR